MFDDILEFFVGMGDLIFGGKKEQKDPISEEKSAEFYLKEHPVKKFNYRPQTLSEYISQDNAKSLIRLLLKEVLEIGKFRPILISGTRGHGKTTLAYVICNHLRFKMNYYIANSFTKENLRDFLVKNETSKIPQVLMLDEVHGLEKEMIEYFYPILSDFQLPNTDVILKPFIIISATTSLDYLQKNYPPFVDRMVNIELIPYTIEEIKLILKNYNNQVYQKNVSEEDFNKLAQNSRKNPRTAILLFDLYVASGNVEEVLKCNGIIESGLTFKDLLVLRHLQDVKKPVGCEALAIISYTDTETFKVLVEPYLIQSGWMSRTARGRLLTSKGEELLRSLDGK